MHMLLQKHRAFTLVELLIVIAIATILATLSLTTIQGLLKDQKITQSVRLAKQYMETARTRAMATGRPVALFLERVSAVGDSAGSPIEANYTVTRMSIGEVFPPYTGEVPLATASLWDTPIATTNSGTYPTRLATDGFADQARFQLAEVITAFGTATTPGMMSVGDTIEFAGNNQRFLIEDIDFVGGEVLVTFFNPPANYDSLLAAKIQAGVSTDVDFEVSYSGREPSLKTRNPALPGFKAPTPPPPPNAPWDGVQFRIYRKPSKSLVGSITMPRGTCIDLSVSGVGPSLCGVDPSPLTESSPKLYPFRLAKKGNPSNPADPVSVVFDNNSGVTRGTIKRSTYSRFAILFNPEGRAEGMYSDDRIVQLPANASDPEVLVGFQPFPLGTKLHLMVGRTEQVIHTAPFTRPNPGDRGDALGNLVDTGNTWLSVNPSTGLIETSPVAPISESTWNAAVVAYQGTDMKLRSEALRAVVSESRKFATTGVNDGGR